MKKQMIDTDTIIATLITILGFGLGAYSSFRMDSDPGNMRIVFIVGIIFAVMGIMLLIRRYEIRRYEENEV